MYLERIVAGVSYSGKVGEWQESIFLLLIACTAVAAKASENPENHSSFLILEHSPVHFI